MKRIIILLLGLFEPLIAMEYDYSKDGELALQLSQDEQDALLARQLDQEWNRGNNYRAPYFFDLPSKSENMQTLNPLKRRNTSHNFQATKEDGGANPFAMGQDQIIAKHLSDVTLIIKVGEKELKNIKFHCSKYMLKEAYWFCDKFNDSKKILLGKTDVKPDQLGSFKNLLSIIHKTNKKTEWSKYEVAQIFQLLDKFEMPCDVFLEYFFKYNNEIMDPYVVENFLDAFEFERPKYKIDCEDFLRKYCLSKETLKKFPTALVAVKKLEKFQKLTLEGVRTLMESKYFSTDFENTVLHLLILWTGQGENQNYLLDLLPCIRAESLNFETIPLLLRDNPFKEKIMDILQDMKKNNSKDPLRLPDRLPLYRE